MARTQLMVCFNLIKDPYRTGWPARYVHVEERNGVTGFITLRTQFLQERQRGLLTRTATLNLSVSEENAADSRASTDDTAFEARLRRGNLAHAEAPRLHRRSAPRKQVTDAISASRTAK